MSILGIDIGGTKIASSEGVVLHTQEYGGAKKALEAVFEAHPGPYKTIGIACPGPLSVKTGRTIRPPNLPGWEDFPVVELFEKRFGCPIFFNNDANACALAELHYGVKKQNLIYLTASTGMGGGIIVDGQLVQGVTDTGGEVGHIVLDINGPPCVCGMRGCFEQYCGGVHLGKINEEHPKWDEFLERFAQGIGILMMTTNPEVVVIGTFARHLGDRLLVPLRERVKKYVWETPFEACEIVASPLGEEIGVKSALALVAQSFIEK
ncbi:MAG: N-acetylmannosamine kinase [Chlamydiia bacterium]|nr:N-acetylmannosamine kinase [Chlamydiia bacterium]MCH9616469.1 N-acetylmannosamine kinase [Chlamydiia bacterium]MCH9629545.1 N-acetylmannosamine kinase [Chlamydiia bacterium]